ncbi:MAG: hydrogenase formation protein HypD, partial [Pirellulales bacterium]
RVPGSRSSLLDARAAGGRVQPVYSPLDAVQLARESPQLQVVFLAVGFETTAPATALAILQARQLQLVNFTLLVTHVRVLPAMELLAADPTTRVAGFLAAGHVCTVMGYDAYQAFVARYGRPVVVTGFEPTDLLSGILDCVTLLEQGTAQVTNRYTRSVQSQGNLAAQRVIEQVYEVCDQEWRGFGVIPGGGWRLREDCRTWDALHRWPDLRDIQPAAAADPSEACPAAEVLAGRLKPTACPHFGTRCVPESPLGAPMVSAEGACSAYYRYGGQRTP